MSPDREALREATERWLARPGFRPEEAVVLGAADLLGDPLDPWSFDDAAIVLRAARLVDDGVHVVDAISTARNERATFAEAVP
jgi:hypothetical protein